VMTTTAGGRSVRPASARRIPTGCDSWRLSRATT
jgi:hypothetical protein